MDAYELREILVSLWSPLLVKEQDFHVDIGDTEIITDNALGVHIYEKTPSAIWKKYAKNRQTKLENIVPQSVIIISPRKRKDSLGRSFLHTAVHEYAHIVRSDMENLYFKPGKQHMHDRFAHLVPQYSLGHDGLNESMTSVVNDFKNFCIDELCGELEYSITDYDSAIFPTEEQRNKSKASPLFGANTVTCLQYDSAHDPLFYLINYLLERKAEDAGLFKKRIKPEVSATWQAV